MKRFPFYLIFCVLTILSGSIQAQHLRDSMDGVYGLDPVLYNGRIYQDYYSSKVKGQQFLQKPEFVSGSLLLRQQFYEALQLNYDIYSQKLLMSFYDANKALRIIEIPQEHIRSFSLQAKYFEVLPWQDSSLRIFQHLGNDHLYFSIFWYKEMETTTSEDLYDYQFTEPKRELWLVIDQQWHLIQNNKSFRVLFPSDIQPQLRKWMKSHRIRMQKAGDESLIELLKYCEK